MSQEIDLGEFQASVVTELDELDSFAQAWESCVRAFGGAYVQQHLDWYRLRSGDSAQAGTPLIVVLSRRGERVGIAPFIAKSTHWRCKLGYRSIVEFPIRQAHAYGDGLLLPSDASVYQAVLLALARCANPCHTVFLECLPTDSVLWQLLSGSAELPIDYWKYTPDGEVPHRRIGLEGTFDDYLKGLKRKDRWNIRHDLGRFDNVFRGRWSVDRVSARPQVVKYIAAVEEISGTSWQGRQLGRHFRETPARRHYLEECAERGWLRCYLLQCDGRPIAFLEGLQPESLYMPDETGYLPDWRDHQPGKVLWYKAIEDLFQWKPPRTMDFGYGDSEYKRQFSNQTTRQVNVSLFRKSLYTGAALVTHSAFARLMRTGRWLLDLTGKREVMRRMLRRR